jgi:YD repeat-containing protein
MKITITALLALVMTVQLLAQCRLVRTENTDSSEVNYYFYDKQGRLSAEKNIVITDGKRQQSDVLYAYNSHDKLMTIQCYTNDTITLIRNLIYEKDVLTRIVTAYPTDTALAIGRFFYNEKGQMIRYFGKSSKGDTLSITCEYAPEGYLKRDNLYFSGTKTHYMTEHIWDSEQKIMDDPSRIFFAGYPLIPSSSIVPIPPLSVKGNPKGYIQYNMDKEGKFVKTSEGEVFDIKANAEGLWIENKYRIKGDPTVYTYRAFYEGCKN